VCWQKVPRLKTFEHCDAFQLKCYNLIHIHIEEYVHNQRIYLKDIFGPMTLFLIQTNTIIAYEVSIKQQHCIHVLEKLYICTYTLAGFEPRSYVPQADSMTTAPQTRVPILRLLNSQLQRQRCSKLERF
jgi:hypothetical protein